MRGVKVILVSIIIISLIPFVFSLGVIDIYDVLPPANTYIGYGMQTDFTLREMVGSGHYYLVDCDYVSPTGRHYYPSTGCNYIGAYSVISDFVTRRADQLGTWYVASCSVYTATDSSCGVLTFQKEVDNIGYYLVSTPPTLGVSSPPRKCIDTMKAWFLNKYGKPWGGSFSLSTSSKPTGRSGTCYDECLSRGYTYGACSVFPAGTNIGTWGSYGCFFLEHCYCTGTANITTVDETNVDGLFIDGKYDVAQNGDSITDDEWGNVLQLLGLCYDTTGYVPTLKEMWFKDTYGSTKRTFMVFVKQTKDVGVPMMNSGLVAFQDGEDLMVWDNVVISVASGRANVSWELLSDKGMAYYYFWNTGNSSAEGVVVMPYSDVLPIYNYSTIPYTVLGYRRWARFHLHEIIPNEQLYWGYEGMSVDSMYPLQDSDSLYFPREAYPNARFKIVNYGRGYSLYDTFNVSSYGFCREIKSSGRYTFNDDVYSVVPRSPCIYITASNVELDLKGHKLESITGGGSIGIAVEPPSPFVWGDSPVRCDNCVSGINIHDGSIIGFSHSGLNVGGIKNSSFSNLNFKLNELGYKQVWGNNITITNFNVRGNQKGMMIHASLDNVISDISGVNVLYDMDINYLNRSSLARINFGEEVVYGTPSHMKFSMAKNSINCYDCQNNNFCSINLLASSSDFNMNGFSKNNYFMNSMFKDSDVEIYGNSTTAKVGIIFNESTSNNYMCGNIGRVKDYGTSNTVVVACPAYIISCEKRICQAGFFCVDNQTSAYANSNCLISNITFCNYTCQAGVCGSKPISEWGLSLLPLLFQTELAQFFGIILFALVGTVGMKVWTGNTVLALVIGLLIVGFGVLIDFVPTWIGLIIIASMVYLLFKEIKEEKE